MGEPTAGDWRAIRGAPESVAFVVREDGRQVATVYGDSHDEQEANAQHMAASKQMLEALEIVAKYDRGNWMDRPWSRAVAKAIAKAKGQE